MTETNRQKQDKILDSLGYPASKRLDIFVNFKSLRLRYKGFALMAKMGLREFEDIPISKPLSVKHLLALNRKATDVYYISKDREHLKITDITMSATAKIFDYDPDMFI